MGGTENPEERKEAAAAEVPKIQPIQKPWSITALSCLGLFVLAIFYTFYFAREFFLPVTMAWMLSMLLNPVVRFLNRLHVPNALGAALVLVILAGAAGLGTILLSDPAAKWMKETPAALDKIEGKINQVMNSASSLKQAAKSVEKLAQNNETETPQVEIKKPGLLNTVWSRTKHALVLAVEVLVLVFFFLAAGDIFTLKLVQILPRLTDKKRALEIVRECQSGVSNYLLSITLVNMFEGAVIGLGLALIGMPNPVLWGVLAFSANYIPYLGAVFAGSVVTIVAILSFDSMSHALLAPLIYFGVNFTDNFISPYVMGKRLVLNPVVVFLAVMFWGWLWGIPGVLLAVPITMTIKIICDKNKMLAPFSEFLTGVREEPVTEEQELKAGLVKGNA